MTGIMTIQLPQDISDKGHTIMPPGLFWIRASAATNTIAVSETIGIHAQAARATARLTGRHDVKRLQSPLPPASVSKLSEVDFNVKKIEQPYASFDGRMPELEGHFYTRASELLRHKGRGHTPTDYELLILEAFPKIYKAKCISHTLGLSAHEYARDLEVAPGFIVMAVIPDLTKLIPGDLLEPRAPVSLLDNIAKYLHTRVSPFARIKVLNSRYEKIDVNITVRLTPGKPQDYYAKQLQTDLTRFFAPWYLGDSEKLAFGQNVYFSDVVGFVENLDYVDHIIDLQLIGPCEQSGSVIRPLTARSILTSGTICIVIDIDDCIRCIPPKEYDPNTTGLPTATCGEAARFLMKIPPPEKNC
ncbi:MAG: hypothetical protein IPH12_14060 [Saprospirales bacterium]|nr:hypothetical protein [Saprospirales bacterium]